jgi:DNA-binding protein HU-beta
MPKTRVEDMLEATVAVLQKELLNGKIVQLPQIGTLEMKRRNARVIVHPKTQIRTEVPEKMQLNFKPNQAAKDMFKQISKED